MNVLAVAPVPTAFSTVFMNRWVSVVMYSLDTRVYVMRLIPATIAVTWTLDVEPTSSSSALLRCSVETRIPMPLSLIARLALLPLFLRLHVQSETPLFAKDIERKLDQAS